MHISGPAQALFELETIYLGLLSRMTKVATNVREAVNAASPKPVLFFPARFDVPEVLGCWTHSILRSGSMDFKLLQLKRLNC